MRKVNEKLSLLLISPNLSKDESFELKNDHMVSVFDALINILEQQTETAQKSCLLVCDNFLTLLENQKKISSQEHKKDHQTSGSELFSGAKKIFDLVKKRLENHDINIALPFIKTFKENFINFIELQAGKEKPREAQIKLFLSLVEWLKDPKQQSLGMVKMCLTSTGRFAFSRPHLKEGSSSEILTLDEKDDKPSIIETRDHFMEVVLSANANKLLVADSEGFSVINLASKKDNLYIDSSQMGIPINFLSINRPDYPWDSIGMFQNGFVLYNLATQKQKVIKTEYKIELSDSFSLSNNQNLFFCRNEYKLKKFQIYIYSFDFSKDTFAMQFSLDGFCPIVASVSSEHLAGFVSRNSSDIKPCKLIILNVNKKAIVNEIAMPHWVRHYMNSSFIIALSYNLFAVGYAQGYMARESNEFDNYIKIYDQWGALISDELLPKAQNFGNLVPNVNPIYNPDTGCILLQGTKGKVYEYLPRALKDLLVTLLQTCHPQLIPVLCEIVSDYLFSHSKTAGIIDSTNSAVDDEESTSLTLS